MEDTLNKAKQWLKEEQAIASESEQQQATTGDQGSDPKQIRVEEEESSGLVDRIYLNILGAHSHPGPPAEEESEDISDELNWSATGMVETHISLLAPLTRTIFCPQPTFVPLPARECSVRLGPFMRGGTDSVEICREMLFPPLQLAAHKLGLQSD